MLFISKMEIKYENINTSRDLFNNIGFDIRDKIRQSDESKCGKNVLVFHEFLTPGPKSYCKFI